MKLHRFAIVVAFFTFLLVIAGGLVTSTGSALSVPDWPLSYGQFFPPMKGGVLFEHGHRLLASTVGFLTIILAIALWRSSAPAAVKRLGGWAIAAVCAQGVLGGVTVLFGLPLAVSVSHACLGQIYFCIMVSIAFLTGPQGLAFAIPANDTRKIRSLSLMTTGFIFYQLVVGAIYRHSGLIFMAHLAGAFLVMIHVLLIGRRILLSHYDIPGLRIPALALLHLLGVQLVLGYLSWRYGYVWLTTAHVAVGALLFATSVIVAIQSFRLLKPVIKASYV